MCVYSLSYLVFMLIIRKKYIIILYGDNGYSREMLYFLSPSGRNCYLCSIKQNLLLLLCRCMLLFFLYQLVYFYTCSSYIVYTKPYKNRSLGVPFACY